MHAPRLKQVDLRDLARWLLRGRSAGHASASWEQTKLLIIRVLLLSRVVFLSIPLILNWGEVGMSIGIGAVLAHGLWLLARGGSPLWAIVIDVPFITFAAVIDRMGSLAVLLVMLYLAVARVGLDGRDRLIGTAIPVAGLLVTAVSQASHSGSLTIVGTLLGVVLVTLALTRVLESVESHRDAAIAEATVRAEERSVTLAMVAHELSTPLTTGKGALALLDDGHVPPEQRLLLDLAAAAFHESAILVSDLRAAVDLERGELQITPQPFRLHDLESELAFAHPASEITIALPDGVANADRVRVTQILHNLVANAEKHGKPPVRVDGWRHNGSWHIGVSDLGPGIPQEDREAIFEPFTQGGHHGEGLGLGLAVSRQLARIMGGDLEVDEQFRDGTQFVLTVPATSDESDLA